MNVYSPLTYQVRPMALPLGTRSVSGSSDKHKTTSSTSAHGTAKERRASGDTLGLSLGTGAGERKHSTSAGAGGKVIKV